MLAGVVATMTVNKDVMRERSGIFFTQASELAVSNQLEKDAEFVARKKASVADAHARLEAEVTKILA